MSTRPRQHRPLAAATFTLALAAAVSLPACRDAESEAKARKAEAKQARDADLLKIAYPPSSGTLPASITTNYDEASDRTTITLRLTDLRLGGPGAAKLRPGSGTLSLTSAHDGRIRPTDNPEGSVDGVFTVFATAPGVLAFAGVPGTLTLDDLPPRPLKDASGKGGYSGASSPAGGEESLRFRIRTEDLVAAASATRITLTLATVQIDLTDRQRADLREFTARLNPKR